MQTSEKWSLKKKQIALALFSVLFTFILLEAGARVWLNVLASEEQFERYSLITEVDPVKIRLSPHPYISYYATPNYKKGLNSHNSLGYRGDEFPLKKPDGVFRIAVLGGSTVYTELVEDNAKTFTAQMEKLLADKYGYKGVHVINAGVPGYTTFESLVDLEMRILDLEPDLLVIYHGTNDVHTRLVAMQAYYGDNSGYRKHWSPPHVPFWQHLCLPRILGRKFGFGHQVGLEGFLEQPTAEAAHEDQLSLLRAHPPVYSERNLESMVAIAKHNNVQIMLATWAHSPFFDDYAATPHYIQGFADMNDVIKRVATRNQVPFYDFAAVMPKEKRYWGDGRHVNEEGALLKAQLFSEFIHNNHLIPETR